MTFPQRDEVVEALAGNCADQSLAECVRLWASDGGHHSYSTGGLLTKKRILAVLQNPVDTNDVSNYTDVEYTYDSEGRRTQMVYPKGRYRDTGSQGAPWMQDASRTLNYTYDSMGRIHTMAEPSPGPSWVSGVTYNAASQPTNFSGLGESRTYNILGQLTQITAGSSFSERYDYSSSQNNGRITGKKNLLSGEEVQYAYDSLQRLQSAITVTDPLVTQWGQNFTYDGWGNLLGASVAKGSAPTFSVTVNGLTNRITGSSYDANGNQAVTGSSYDVENRLKGAGTYPNYYQYTYDGSNKRVAKSVPLTWDAGNGTVSGEELLMFYGAGGERLAEFTMSIVKFGTPSQWYLRFTEKKTLVWFGSKLLRDGKYSVIQDRLGSVRWRRDTTNNQTETADYYPYGQEKPSATTNDREKFATYLRDPESGLDYADQRYHNPGWGRFLTADPYQASAGAGQPGSWNRYAYVEGDPANYRDSKGLDTEDPDPVLTYCEELGINVLPGLCPKTGYPGDIRDPGTTYCNPGPGGGNCPEPVQTKIVPEHGSLTDQYRQKLSDAIDGLSASCKEKLPVGQLSNGVSNVEFWNGSRPSGDGAIRASDIFAGSSDKTLHELSTGRGAWVVRSREGISNHIVLTAAFLNVLNPHQQASTLVHEAMHAILKSDDTTLGGIAYKYGAAATKGGPSFDFQQWLEKGCQDTRPPAPRNKR